MKHNPRLNEKIARLEGFSEIHPLQPISTCQGALELIDLISSWLKELTGMKADHVTQDQNFLLIFWVLDCDWIVSGSLGCFVCSFLLSPYSLTF